jgi:AAA15 family ATPase/GTPase
MVKRVEVNNYKCLREVRQDLGRFQILVGPNASGKSTFLDVFSFVRDLLDDGVEEGGGVKGWVVK